MEQTDALMRYDMRFSSAFDGVDPYQWFTILPYGKFERWGRKVEVTREMVAEMVSNFRIVPPNELPVNREHQGQFGKVGNIRGLRAGMDGLQASINWFDSGLQLIKDKAFQYFSAEVIFRPIDFDSRMFRNILTGLAVTNEPYFGSLTSMYSRTEQESVSPGEDDPIVVFTLADQIGAETMAEDKEVGRLAAALEAIASKFTAQPAPAVEPPDNGDTERLAVIQQENEDLKAKLAAIEAKQVEDAQKARVAKYAALLGEGMEAAAEKFAAIQDEALADSLVEEFKALDAQQETAALFGEIGGSTPVDNLDDPAEKYEQMAQNLATERKIDITEAYSVVAKEHPDLYHAYRAAVVARN